MLKECNPTGDLHRKWIYFMIWWKCSLPNLVMFFFFKLKSVRSSGYQQAIHFKMHMNSFKGKWAIQEPKQKISNLNEKSIHVKSSLISKYPSALDIRIFLFLRIIASTFFFIIWSSFLYLSITIHTLWARCVKEICRPLQLFYTPSGPNFER